MCLRLRLRRQPDWPTYLDHSLGEPGAVGPMHHPGWPRSHATASTELLTAGRPIAAPTLTTPAPSPAGTAQTPYIAHRRPTPLPGRKPEIGGSPITVTPTGQRQIRTPGRSDIAQWIATNDDEQAVSTDTPPGLQPNTLRHTSRGHAD